MSTAYPETYLQQVIVPHPQLPQVLVERSSNGWRLPAPCGEAGDPRSLAEIEAALQERYGLHAHSLQQAARQEDEATQQIRITYLLENLSGDWMPNSNLRWIGMDELTQVAFVDVDQQTAVRETLMELTSGQTPPLRAPSARPGWRHQAEVWIHSELARLERPPTGPVTLVKNWFLSCLLKVPTAQGTIYFKATHGSALMVNEAAMTRHLAERYPHAVPRPLAVHPELSWMLLDDFGAEVGWEAPVAMRMAALQAFARLQRASAADVDGLLRQGCIERRLERLAEQIDPLVHDDEILALLTPEQQQALRAGAERLKAICAELASYRIPATLVHGDLHMSNVAKPAEHYLFFDWSDACITHPFLDMIDILHERDPALQLQLRDCYLAEWRDYESPERLLTLWQLAYPLCALHQAVSYQAILRNTEPRCQGELAWAMPFWCRQILQTLEGTA